MRKIQYIIYVALASLLFTACQEEDFSSGAKGGIRISLTEDAGVDVSTRSTPAELGTPLVAEFKIEVKNSAGNNKYSGKLPDNKEIPLDAGSYDVIAYYGTNETLALDSPYYEGSKEAVEVKDGYTTSVELTCKVANALLSIQINEDDKKKFDEAFKTPSFQLTVGGKSVATSDLTKSFYFKAGSTISKLAFSKDGSDYQDLGIKNWPKEIKAADHIIVTVGIEPAPSGVSLTVSKVDVVPVTITETIPLEWLPKPSVSATGFDSNNNLTFAETETKEAKLDLTLASALQDIKFKFDFQDEQFSLDEEKEYTWSTDKAEIEKLGISISDNSVDLNGLLAKLQTNAGVSTTNTIEVDVKANDRWSSEDEEANHTYTITCNKPEFSIAVQPGNVWTKTFTIDEPTITVGNAEVLKEKLVYQYKEKDADDNAWQTCSDGLEQVFSETPANKAYQVRAFYREGIASEEVTVTLETPAQLPNSDMEEWYTEEFSSIRSYYPWASNGTSFWNTNNNYTTRYRVGGSTAGYNSFPAVSYVSGRNGGKAAELRNTASGQYNIDDFGLIKHKEQDYNKVAGELFIGDITVNSESYEISTKGKEFDSRPTALQFYYKYKPLNGNDTWKVHFELLDESRETIISKEFTSSESMSDYGNIPISVQLDYEEGRMYPKCKYIYVVFSSTIYTGSSLPYEQTAYYLQENGESLRYSKVYVGSVLTIDDISLVYDK